MTVISLRSGKEISSLPRGCSVALGFFDGVHTGHREILKCAVEKSQREGRESAVWMISSDGSYKSNNLLLTDEKEKLALIEKLGVGYAVISSFEDIRELSGDEFVRRILSEELGAACVVCGFNFRFGKGAAWDTSDLAELCKSFGIAQITVPAVTFGGENVSSSRIRRLVSAGDVETAARLLGRHYSFCLPVLCGKMLGRRLGFPTANQIPPKNLVCPPRGVYATAVTVDGKSYPGSTNVGVCPTVTEEILRDSGLTDAADGAAGGERAVAETYIDGFSGDLYGRKVKISFLKRIRGEMRFASISELTERIAQDSRSAKVIFEAYENNKGDVENEQSL